MDRRPVEEDHLKAIVTALHTVESMVDGCTFKYPYAAAKVLRQLLKEQGVKLVTMPQHELDEIRRNVESLHPDYRR